MLQHFQRWCKLSAIFFCCKSQPMAEEGGREGGGGPSFFLLLPYSLLLLSFIRGSPSLHWPPVRICRSPEQLTTRPCLAWRGGTPCSCYLKKVTWKKSRTYFSSILWIQWYFYTPRISLRWHHLVHGHWNMISPPLKISNKKAYN